MKYTAALLFGLLLFSCANGDKQREDFPATTQEGDRRSNERLGDEHAADTLDAGDTALHHR